MHDPMLELGKMYRLSAPSMALKSLIGAPGDKQGTLEFLKLIFRALCLCWDRQTQDLHVDWVLYRGRSLVPVFCEVVNDNIDGFYSEIGRTFFSRRKLSDMYILVLWH
ncbi:hypothetical protein IFM89_034734 [Coptis chinensis]|uniref:Uncharacterized protein n=1 Tax=Coptis chinensis TaxID=261450 RepID=A0A835H7L2_9MAGN|nr:hypothetical protein IFM89_034734 [Coptis chinensis]